MTKRKDLIDSWFAEHGGGGLVLPDGWFGRPHDNVHWLSFSVERPGWLILELDERLLLVVGDAQEVLQEGRDLIIRRFSSCVFEWKEYDTGRRHLRHYETGSVKLVASPEARRTR